MSLVKRWVVLCDEPGCDAVIVHDPIPYGEKADYGMATNDRAWDARPGREETYCPAHVRQDVGVDDNEPKENPDA